MSGQPLRVIHAGVGGRGRWPLEVVGADPRFQSVALVDIVPETLADARASTGLPEAYCFDTLAKALDTVGADALIICTPTRTHSALCREGFAAGLHVLVEKGMTLEWSEATALVDAAEHAGVRFCVSQNYRYTAEQRTLRHLLGSGAYGTPHLIDLVHHRYRPEPRTLDYPFAMVWDMACHHFDNLLAAFGPVEQATAVSFGAPWSSYHHDAGVTAVLEFRNGPLCTYQLTHQATVSEYRFLVQTERGGLRWDGRQWRFLPKPDRHLGTNPEALPLENVPSGRPERGVIDDWYRFIVDAVEPGISGRCNLETLAVCEMVVRSATARRPVRRGELK